MIRTNFKKKQRNTKWKNDKKINKMELLFRKFTINKLQRISKNGSKWKMFIKDLPKYVQYLMWFDKIKTNTKTIQILRAKIITKKNK